MNYGFKENAKYCVANLGGCGGTMMTRYLTDKMGRDSVFGVHKRDFTEFDGKVIFLFGNPMNAVISMIERTKNNQKLHFEHMGGDYNRRLWWDTEDVLRMEELFDDWYRSHPFAMISARYETLWNPSSLRLLEDFLELDLSDFPKKQERKSNWEKHLAANNIYETYKRLNSKIESAKDIKIWN